MIGERVGRRSRSVIGLSLFAAFCGAFLSSCADLRIPEYQRPESPEKAAWSGQTPASVPPSDAISLDWWQEFRAPYLDALVTKAIAGSFDLKILAARMQVAA